MNRLWSRQHSGSGTSATEWLDNKYRREELCDVDKYPPAYFFTPDDPVITNSQQLVRLLPANDNRGAGQLWRQFCFTEGLKAVNTHLLTDAKDPVEVKTDGSEFIVPHLLPLRGI